MVNQPFASSPFLAAPMPPRSIFPPNRLPNSHSEGSAADFFPPSQANVIFRGSVHGRVIFRLQAEKGVSMAGFWSLSAAPARRGVLLRRHARIRA